MNTDLADAVDEYGGFLAGYKSWLADQEGDDVPSPQEVVDLLQMEYHDQVERQVIDDDMGGFGDDDTITHAIREYPLWLSGYKMYFFDVAMADVPPMHVVIGTCMEKWVEFTDDNREGYSDDIRKRIDDWLSWMADYYDKHDVEGGPLHPQKAAWLVVDQVMSEFHDKVERPTMEGVAHD